MSATPLEPLRTALILLAAGASTRMGEPKQLLRYQGETLVRRAARAGLDAGCAPVVVVLGAQAERVRAELTGLPSRIVENLDWQNGMGSSIAAGAQALAEEECAAAIVAVCDQPHLTADHLRRLIDTAQAHSAAIVVSDYGRSMGPPVLFRAPLLPELAVLSGEQGARQVIARHRDHVVTVPFPEGALDIDTPDAYRRLIHAEPTGEVAAIVKSVLASAKYRAVDAGLIRRIAATEIERRRTAKEALEATRSRLHQIAGAYLDRRPPYAAWTAALEAAGDDRERVQGLCREMMQAHASTRERLPALDRFYAETLAGVPPPASVVDVACGLNPLAIPWMPLPPGATYTAYDIYTDQADFLDRFLQIWGCAGGARACDVIASPPTERVDLALVLKTLPVLDMQSKGGGIALLQSLNAANILVSFPAQSLGGRKKGMRDNYAERFLRDVVGLRWQLDRFDFAAEICFLLHCD